MKTFLVEHKDWVDNPDITVTLYNPPYDDETILSKTNWKLKDVTIGDGKIGVHFQDDKGENFIILYNVDDGKQIGRLTFSFSK